MVPQASTLVPTDDVWVYPHAGDPGKDAYLRVWGRDGQAVAKLVGDASDFSYSLLSFDVSALPADHKLASAKLELTMVPNPQFAEAQAKKYPLEVRSVPAGFKEQTWKYDLLEKFGPSVDPKSVFGTGVPDPWPKADEESKIVIDLLKGPGDFAGALKTAQTTKSPLGLALTTTLDVTLNDEVQSLYKVYSKDAPVEASRPRLILSFQ